MTSTVQDRKPPSAGTKVEPGNAPVVKESAGKVGSESLAAESKREGGEFASNSGIRSENVSAESKSESKSSESKSSGISKSTGSSENAQSQSSRTEHTSKSSESSGGDAPYANALKQTDSHGKRVKESGWKDDAKDEDGLKKALESEPGSENDPSRLAEQKFRQLSPGGPREAKLDTETRFENLNPEEST